MGDALSDASAAKAEARKAGFARRKLAHENGDPRAAAAQAHLAGLLDQAPSAPLAGYLPIRSEIDPCPVMARHASRAPVGVPVIDGPGQPLSFALWTPQSQLVTGPFGVFVPADPDVMVPRILIVPLVAFAPDGGRLGYGGGFYDRTLAGLRQTGPVLAVGFAYAAQRADRLPLEQTDARLDLIVTEEGLAGPAAANPLAPLSSAA